MGCMTGDDRSPQLAVMALVLRRLEVLKLRRVPVRALRPGPIRGVTRMQWGDGTTLLVRSLRPGSMASVQAAINKHRPVLVLCWASQPSELVMRMQVGTGGRQLVDVIVIGLDQPD